MLGLKLPTDPRWANIAEKNIEEILTDHAYCEQKAASTAISLIVGYPEKPELVDKMTALAREEMGHFQMVHNRIMQRGLVLGRERKDAYVVSSTHSFPGRGSRASLDPSLVGVCTDRSSFVRTLQSAEREFGGQRAQEFYHTLMISEANHYTMFLKLARKYGNREEVDQMWQDLLEYEAEVISKLGTEGLIHG